MRTRARGFTLVELACVILVAGGAAITLSAGQPGESPFTKARAEARKLRDQTCVRGIMTAFEVFSGNNGGNYPLASLLDKDNQTVKEAGAAKNTTANILSLLISQGFVPAEMYVSAAEVNRSIRPDDRYEFSMPKAAVDPVQALWDPAFSADFTNGKTGNVSFAMLIPTTSRQDHWKSSQARTPFFANRGPDVKEIRDDNGTLTPVLEPAVSNTFKIHGGPDSWEGNLGFNDQSVTFISSMLESDAKYKDAAGKERADALFYDEPNDPAHTNYFLGIFTVAGEKESEFTSIWD